jgi:hypothetical protein
MESLLNYYVVTSKIVADSTLPEDSVKSLVDILSKGTVIAHKNRFTKPTGGLSIIASFETYATFEDAVGSIPIGPVNNGFTAGISQLEEILDAETLSELQVTGIIEATRDSSIISFIIDNYDIENNQQAILDIIDIGIVSYYDPAKDLIVLSGVETFLKYAEAVGDPIWSNLLKYNTYGEAI